MWALLKFGNKTFDMDLSAFALGSESEFDSYDEIAVIKY